MCATSLVFLTILAQATPLTADPQAKTQAQELLSQGSKLYHQGDLAGALEKFEAAYVAFPSPKLMFNIGQAKRDLGRPVEAIEAFQRFLAEATDASPETMAEARKSVAELQSKLGKIRIDCDTAGAEIAVDGKSVGVAPLPDLIWATPGRHQVTAKHVSAAPAIEDVEVATGSVSTVTMRLLPLTVPLAAPAPKAAAEVNLQAAPSPSSASERWWLGRKWTWVAAGSTVLLAAGAITAGVLMQDKFDSLRSSCGAGNLARPGCPQSDIDSVSSRQTMANVFWGLTAAAAATTGVLFYFEGRPVTVTPVAGGVTGALAKVGF
ncbi:MAG TPA: tetratricopeptide repeat protein [Polyangia bacterium]|nr:tetratricopeptide repeat protein [Polyangia bacterium]